MCYSTVTRIRKENMAKEKKEEPMNNVVNKSSDGYGYKYASLGDIAKQGFMIPKMKTASENEKEYIYYFDTDLKEWIRGAEIVVPESKGMNKAQLYGSALTYARRYTSHLALQLACDLDENIENLDANGEMKTDKGKKKEYKNAEPRKATASQIKYLKDLYTQHEELLKFMKVNTFEELTYEQASELITNKENKIKQEEEFFADVDNYDNEVLNG